MKRESAADVEKAAVDLTIEENVLKKILQEKNLCLKICKYQQT